MYPAVSQHLIKETDHLQDEIRQLERSLNTLSHKSSTLSESCRRGSSEVDVLRRETLRVEADVREQQARDATVAASVLAIQDSGRLLAGMETQARADLDQEVKRTRDQRVQMEGTIMGAKLQASQVEERLLGVEVYAQVKELEKVAVKSRQELEERRRRSIGAGSRGGSLTEERDQWKLFKEVVLESAKAWKGRELATKAVAEEGEALDELKRNIARMREVEEAARQEELRRRTEQEGWARLDKVSSEVDRMERVLDCRTSQRGRGIMESERDSLDAGCVERSLGEDRVKGSMNGDNQRREDNSLLEQTVGDDCSQAQRNGIGAREYGGFSSTSTSSLSSYIPPTPSANQHGGFSSTPTSSLSSYVPPTPRRLGVQLKLCNSLLKKSPSTNQVPEEQRKCVQPDASQVADAVVPHVVQANLGQQQSVLGGFQEKQEEFTLRSSGARSEQQQISSPRQWRLPLPKLRSLVRTKSSQEERIESGRRVDLEEGFSTQTLQKVDDTPAASSNSGMPPNAFEQEEVRFSTASPSGHPESENKSGNEKLGRRSLPKLNLFGRTASGLFKRSKDKDFEDEQPQLPAVSGNVVCESNQQVNSAQQRHKDGARSQHEPSTSILPQLEEKVAHGTSLDQEHLVWVDQGSVNVPQSDVPDRQARATATVPAEAAHKDQLKVADQDCGKESDLEEGEFYDVHDNNVTGADRVGESEDGAKVGQLEVEEGEIPEPTVPSTSSVPGSPRITPGKRRLPPLKLSPGTALNDSKREAAFKDLLENISQEQEKEVVPSLPKAPRLQLASPVNPSDGKSFQEAHVSPKKRTNEAISFNMADLEQGEPKQEVVTTPCAGSSSIPTKEESSSASKNLFGGGDTGFGFNFDDTCDNSFSFFGNGGCKSPEQGEKDGQFFLNFGDGDGDKMEEDSGWNFFGQ